LFCAQLSAQSSPNAPSPQANLTADQLVDQLVENARAYRATLPSLAAHETILSKTSAVVVFGKSAVQAEATMRVMRKTPGGQLEESREFTTVNGKPHAAGKPVALPLTVQGAFDDFPAAFFDRENVPCYSFVLGPHLHPDALLTLSISLSPQAAALSQCKGISAALTAIAQIDPTARQLVHLERTFPAEPEETKARILFMSIDLAPTKIGRTTFWLPTIFNASAVDGKARLEWASHYSDYHQFTATSTILPAPMP
jgi:hypothetical protein